MSRQITFECPRCGHVHTCAANEITHGKYIDFTGCVRTCSFKLMPGRKVLQCYVGVGGELRKDRILRVDLPEEASA